MTGNQRKAIIDGILDKIDTSFIDLVEYANQLEDNMCENGADELRQILGQLEQWEHNFIKTYCIRRGRHGKC